MSRSLLVTASLMAVLTAGSARAADMNALRAAPYALPAYNWTGCYVGAQSGGVAYRNSLAGTWTDGALLGGEGGCNYQFDHLVVGVEAEGAWSSADSTQSFGFVGGGLPSVLTFKNEWDAAVSLRMGLAYDRFWIFGKIGATWSDNHFTGTFPAGLLGVFGAGTTLTGSVTSPGLLWGLGFEYGLTPHWTTKMEIDFTYLAATDMNFSCTAVAPGTCAGSLSVLSINSMAFEPKVGINYRW